jgi:hypothetical protein
MLHFGLNRAAGTWHDRTVDALDNPMTIEQLTIESFRDKIGHAFVVEEEGQPAIALALTVVAPLTNYGHLARAPFSLQFTSTGAEVLPQRIYPLRHTSLGLQSIFIVPIAKQGDVVTYQAVFN